MKTINEARARIAELKAEIATIGSACIGVSMPPAMPVGPRTGRGALLQTTSFSAPVLGCQQISWAGKSVGEAVRVGDGLRLEARR